MDEDRTKGAAAQAKGSMKEVVGKVTGNAAMEADDVAQKRDGQARKTLGLSTSKARTALDNN